MGRSVLIKNLYQLLATGHQNLRLRMLSKSILLGLVACSIIAICYSLPQLPRSEMEGNELARGYRHFQLGKRDAEQPEAEANEVTRGYRHFQLGKRDADQHEAEGNEVARGYKHFQLGKRDAEQQEPEGKGYP